MFRQSNPCWGGVVEVTIATRQSNWLLTWLASILDENSENLMNTHHINHMFIPLTVMKSCCLYN